MLWENQTEQGGGGYSPTKVMGCSLENFKNTSKKY